MLGQMAFTRKRAKGEPVLVLARVYWCWEVPVRRGVDSSVSRMAARFLEDEEGVTGRLDERRAWREGRVVSERSILVVLVLLMGIYVCKLNLFRCPCCAEPRRGGRGLRETTAKTEKVEGNCKDREERRNRN